MEVLGATGESETLGLKETLGSRCEAAMTVCAFRNQRGWSVMFGVTQAGGHASSQTANAVAVEGSFVGDEHAVA